MGTVLHVAEGDSIHRLARRLNEQLSGRQIVTADIRRRNQWDLARFTFSEVVPVGKHVLMRLSRGDENLTIHSHLRMDGRWTLLGPQKCLPKKLDVDVRLALTLDTKQTLVALTMPVLELLETSNERDVVGHLGPDVLAADFDIEDASRRLRLGVTPIVQTLLDQRGVCGIGNLWAIEVLFLRGVYPWTSSSEVDTHALLAKVRKMMLYSRDVQPGMITTGNARKGSTHWVYGRYRRPCRRCSTPIDFRPGGCGPYDREVWWCPHCQPNTPTSRQ